MKEKIMPEDAIPPGKIKCFITAKLRSDTPEERVRQEVARALVEEYGYEKTDMDVEFPVKMGRATKRADIVVFSHAKLHTQENIYLLSEVKREDIKPADKKEGLGQLESYISACPNCKFSLWVGKERLTFETIEEKGERKLTHIPDIPKYGDTTIPRPVRGSLVPAVSLKQVFKRIHNYIYVNQGLQKDKAFEELQKLIFVKVYDEQYSPTLQFYILPKENILDVKARLSKVFDKVQSRFKYIFSGKETLDLNDSVLSYVIAELQRFSLVNTETDVKGEAYETLVGPNLRGDRGEFFTARNVCNMTVDMLFALVKEDKLTSPGALKILDPAVGTGGFLISGIQSIKQFFLERGYKYDQLRDAVKDIANNNFYGIDFNPFLVRVSQMNMVMHGDGSSNIVHANSLEKTENWNEEAQKLMHVGEFDIVVTNPPFGTKAVIDNPDILEQFNLTKYGAASPRNSLPPEQLFIERCLDFLKPGGYLGIVLPDSILSNPGLQWIRKWILEKTYIIASIDMPVETFEPHTGTQTSVLILKKKTPEQEKRKEDYSIFMAIPEKVGHDRRGVPIYKTTPEGKIELDDDGEKIIDDHIPFVTEMFKKWIKEKGMI
ncbi:MAG: N-6 DNA methylase [Pseudomonadota bacterium]